LEFEGFNTPAYDFLDDVSVVGVPDAGSTLSLLSFASLGLVALRRKLRC
jgi:VPDSG-CTERM motif